MTNKSIRDYINLIENAQREGVAEGSEQDDPYKGTTPTNGKIAARNGHKLGKTYNNPHSPKYHKDSYAAWDRDYNNETSRLKNKGVAEGSLNEGQYEMMMRNGQVKKFIAKDDADAKRIAKGHGAKSVIKLRGGVPAGKIAEQGVAEGSEKHECPHCLGSGRMVRDPDIGTDQECFVCDGTGYVNDEQGVAEDQVEESSPESIAKIEQLTRRP